MAKNKDLDPSKEKINAMVLSNQQRLLNQAYTLGSNHPWMRAALLPIIQALRAKKAIKLEMNSESLGTDYASFYSNNFKPAIFSFWAECLTLRKNANLDRYEVLSVVDKLQQQGLDNIKPYCEQLYLAYMPAAGVAVNVKAILRNLLHIYHVMQLREDHTVYAEWISTMFSAIQKDIDAAKSIDKVDFQLVKNDFPGILEEVVIAEGVRRTQTMSYAAERLHNAVGAGVEQLTDLIPPYVESLMGAIDKFATFPVEYLHISPQEDSLRHFLFALEQLALYSTPSQLAGFAINIKEKPPALQLHFEKQAVTTLLAALHRVEETALKIAPNQAQPLLELSINLIEKLLALPLGTEQIRIMGVNSREFLANLNTRRGHLSVQHVEKFVALQSKISEALASARPAQAGRPSSLTGLHSSALLTHAASAPSLTGGADVLAQQRDLHEAGKKAALQART